MLAAVQTLDTAILLFIQEHIRCGFLDAVMKAASWLGNGGILWIALAVVLLAFKKTRRGGLDMALCLAVAAILCNLVLKGLVARPRPFLTVEELELIIAPLTSYSFPSGHACSSFACATALTLSWGKRGAWAFLPASLIALSRIYVGIHYPTDVVCGALLGILTAWGVWALSRRFPCRSAAQARSYPEDTGSAPHR